MFSCFDFRNAFLYYCYVLFFFLLPFKYSYSQTPDKQLFFDDNLLKVIQERGKSSAIINDNVRAKVVELLPTHEILQLPENQRDSAITYAFWLKPMAITEHSGTLIGEDSVYYLRYLANRSIQFNHYLQRDLNTKGVITDGEWQHIGLVLSSKGVIKLFFNGDLLLQDSIAPTWWKKRRKGKIVIGEDLYGVKANGCIDELKIWSRALSDEQMTGVYENSIRMPDLWRKLEIYLPLKTTVQDNSLRQKVVIESTDVLLVADSVRENALEFTGSNAQLVLGDIRLGNQLTTAMWIKPNSKEYMLGLIGNRDFSFRYIHKKSELFFSVPMLFGEPSSIFSVKTGEWVHCAIALNYNHKATFYVNGKSIGSVVLGSKSGLDKKVTIGRSIWGNQFNGRMSEVALWNRCLTPKEIQAVYKGNLSVELTSRKSETGSRVWLLWSSIGLLTITVTGLLGLFVIRGKNERKGKEKTILDEAFPMVNAIFFMDKFRAYNSKGVDVTTDFTPIIIRLFALILIFKQAYGRYISSQEISDVLWETDNVGQQKNNRGTNIHRLRKILEGFDGLELLYKGKEWVVSVPEHTFIDIDQLPRILLAKEYAYPWKSLRLTTVIQATNFEGLLTAYSESTIALLRAHATLLYADKQWVSLCTISELWVDMAPLDEEPIAYLLNAQVQLKKKTLALLSYDSYRSNYKRMLNEVYDKTFIEVVDSLS